MDSTTQTGFPQLLYARSVTSGKFQKQKFRYPFEGLTLTLYLLPKDSMSATVILGKSVRQYSDLANQPDVLFKQGMLGD